MQMGRPESVFVKTAIGIPPPDHARKFRFYETGENCDARGDRK